MTYQIKMPDIDSPTLEEEMAEILKSDREQLMKLCLLIESFNWHEKMAVGLFAYHQIDPTHTQLFRLVPAHGELSTPLKQAIEFVEKLSPQALAELAADILSEDFEIRVPADDDDDDNDDEYAYYPVDQFDEDLPPGVR